ncbi:MAG: NmrA family NAD(P)-binding protein [Ktedonobacterales bacterium]
MILVTGATGNVGREVARLLLAGGQPVIAVTRNPAHPQSLASALRGVETIFISPRALGDATAGAAATE